MSKIRIYGDTSGYIDVAAPATADNSTLDLSTVAKTNQENTFTQNQYISGGDAITQEIRSSGNQAHFRMVSDLNNSSWMISNESNANRMRIMHTDTGSSTSTFPMYIYEAGYVTTPSQPKFYGYMTGGGAQAPSTETILIMDTVPVNVGGHYNTSNGRFTAPVSGWYHFTLAVYWESSSSYTRTRINVNGNQKWYTISPSQGPHTERAAGELYLSAGDYVDARIQPTNATDYFKAEAHTSFAGYLIG